MRKSYFRVSKKYSLRYTRDYLVPILTDMGVHIPNIIFRHMFEICANI